MQRKDQRNAEPNRSLAPVLQKTEALREPSRADRATTGGWSWGGVLTPPWDDAGMAVRCLGCRGGVHAARERCGNGILPRAGCTRPLQPRKKVCVFLSRLRREGDRAALCIRSGISLPTFFVKKVGTLHNAAPLPAAARKLPCHSYDPVWNFFAYFLCKESREKKPRKCSTWNISGVLFMEKLFFTARSCAIIGFGRRFCAQNSKKQEGTPWQKSSR